MRIKSMRFVILQVSCMLSLSLRMFTDHRLTNMITMQTFGGIMWYLGFVVRFGHFPRTGLLYSCNFWNFHVSIVFGFMLWAACIVFRLLRLHLLFNHGISSIKGLSLANQPFTIIFVLCIPHIIIYGVVLPMSNAVVRRRNVDECLYAGGVWAWSDNLFFFAVWALLFGPCLKVIFPASPAK